MMKKMKKIMLGFMMLTLTLVSAGAVYAHSVELDPDSLISFPMMLTNGKGSITIKSSETNYTLNYQAVEIPDATYQQIEKTRTDGEAELKTMKEEYKELETIYEEKVDAYNELVKNGGSETEIEAARTASEEAKQNCKDKGDAYNTKLEEVNNKIQELIPSYVESNWRQTTDNKIEIDTSTFSGDKSFAVWVKLDSSGKTSYDVGIYTTSGTKKEVEEPDIDSSEPPSTQKEEGKKKVDGTVSKVKLPATGTLSCIVIAGIAVLSVVGIVAYKKVKYLNFK